MALVFRTNNHYSAVSFDYFALVAHGFYRRSDFHFVFSLFYKNAFLMGVLLRFASPCDSAFGKIVRTHFQLNRVSFDDTNIVHTKFT